MSEGKSKRKPYNAVNTTRNAKRQAGRVARKFGNSGAFLTKHTARAKRRAKGDYDPVNKAASVAQAPDGRYARNERKEKNQRAAQNKAEVLALVAQL